MTSTPAPISLVISPDFGSFHIHPDRSERFHKDFDLIGRIIPIKNISTVEIGRHSDCIVQINRAGARDDKGYDCFNAIARKHCTLIWADCGNPAYHWLSESQWLIMAGGVFFNSETGTRESSGNKAQCYINGERLSHNNPEPLFRPGQSSSKLCVGSRGKIIVIDGLLREDTTAFPREIWTGSGWPSDETPSIIKSREDTSPGVERQALEDQVIQEKVQEQAPPPPAPNTWPGLASQGMDWIGLLPTGRLVLILLAFLAGLAIFLILGFAAP